MDIDSVLISQPDNGEQGLEICEALVRSGAVDVVIVDSVAALTPRAEIEGDMGEAHVVLHGRNPHRAGRNSAKQYLRDNTDIAASVAAQVREELKKHTGTKSSKDAVSENSKIEDFPS